MIRVAICSMFRDSQMWHGTPINQVDRFFVQMQGQSSPPEKLYCLEGNSKDDTWNTLQLYSAISSISTELYQKETTYPKVISIADQRRIKSMSVLGDYLLEQVKDAYDYILWVESDLIIPNNLIESLVDSVEGRGHCVVAPLIFVEGTGNFYDTWGFREVNGKTWHYRPSKGGVGLVEFGSVGSCVLFSAELLAKGLRFGENGFVSFCQKARELGAIVYANTDTTIWHPKSMKNVIRGRLV